MCFFCDILSRLLFLFCSQTAVSSHTTRREFATENLLFASEIVDLYRTYSQELQECALENDKVSELEEATTRLFPLCDDIPKSFIMRLGKHEFHKKVGLIFERYIVLHASDQVNISWDMRIDLMDVAGLSGSERRSTFRRQVSLGARLRWTSDIDDSGRDEKYRLIRENDVNIFLALVDAAEVVMGLLDPIFFRSQKTAEFDAFRQL